MLAPQPGSYSRLGVRWLTCPVRQAAYADDDDCSDTDGSEEGYSTSDEDGSHRHAHAAGWRLLLLRVKT